MYFSMNLGFQLKEYQMREPYKSNAYKNAMVMRWRAKYNLQRIETLWNNPCIYNTW